MKLYEIGSQAISDIKEQTNKGIAYDNMHITLPASLPQSLWKNWKDYIRDLSVTSYKIKENISGI